MNLKRESLDGEPVHSFIHSPTPAHTLFYTRAIPAGGANPRGVRGRIRPIDVRLAWRSRVPTATQTDRPMSYDPAIVGYYGKLVERWAADNYPIELDYPEVDGLKFDATGEGGRP